jgi:hypothetical protein
MKLSELHPRFGQAVNRPMYLTFDCPTCGEPYRVSIPVNVNGMTGGADFPVWQCSAPTPPDFSWDAITVSPSIDNTPSGHGRKKSCSWHGNIINGEVL